MSERKSAVISFFYLLIRRPVCDQTAAAAAAAVPSSVSTEAETVDYSYSRPRAKLQAPVRAGGRNFTKRGGDPE